VFVGEGINVGVEVLRVVGIAVDGGSVVPVGVIVGGWTVGWGCSVGGVMIAVGVEIG
jgi:hypothetical protein